MLVLVDLCYRCPERERIHLLKEHWNYTSISQAEPQAKPQAEPKAEPKAKP
jgi:hypothetical protein